MYKLVISVTLLCICLWTHASELEVNFGLVLKNEFGEPVGFKETTHIPAYSDTQPSLFGFVVSRDNDQPFLLGAVHILPGRSPDTFTKIMGKPMMIVNRGAIFMQTSPEDIAGNYKVEIYVDNTLYQTIDYQLVLANPADPFSPF